MTEGKRNPFLKPKYKSDFSVVSLLRNDNRLKYRDLIVIFPNQIFCRYFSNIKLRELNVGSKSTSSKPFLNITRGELNLNRTPVWASKGAFSCMIIDN